MVGVNMRSQARASSPRPPTPTPRRRRPLTPQLIWQDTSCVGVLPDELLRSPGAPCSSGRAVVGTTPGMMRVRTAPYVARAHASCPTQSRHISCAAKPLSAEKLPPTACGTRAHQEGKTSPCTQAGLCYRTALLMCMGMFPLVGRACVGVCVGAGVLCDHSGATRQASTPLPRHPRKRRHIRAAPMRLHRRQTRRRVRTAPASRAHTSACLTARASSRD